ncbi:MobF family relaxase [Paenarthrobacter sp. CM16]|uniref:MobF family relaxase n=1 Tax=Paenarthrobacter sp. CM16 TaxID=2738447 RepID=UPI0028118106|nr:MobF family relaxase [Paenarthrobacter sp. CM16]
MDWSHTAQADPARGPVHPHPNRRQGERTGVHQGAFLSFYSFSGIAQTSVKGGLTATAFRHHDSRLGDPNLHTHLVVSNKVQDFQGNWKTIDGKLLHRSAVAVSEHYNTRIQAYLEEHGVEFEARTVNGSKQPVMEIASIPRELNTLFSKRSTGIRSSLTELRQAYEEQHGHSPDQAALIKLAQAATLDTRPDKEAPKTLAEQAQAWRQEAATLFTEKDLKRITGTRSRTFRPATAEIDIDATARQIVAAVSDKRSTWTAQNVMAEVNRWAREYAVEHGPVPALHGGWPAAHRTVPATGVHLLGQSAPELYP